MGIRENGSGVSAAPIDLFHDDGGSRQSQSAPVKFLHAAPAAKVNSTPVPEVVPEIRSIGGRLLG